MDPFDTAGADVPGTGQANLGAMVQSPSFWQNLASFGANLSAAANARNGQGFLTYGNGFAGPLGAATQQTMADAQHNAAVRSQLASQGAATVGQQLQNERVGMEMPYLRALAHMQTGMVNQMSGGLPLASGAPQSDYAFLNGAPSQAASSPAQASDDTSSPSVVSNQPLVVDPKKRQSLLQTAVAGTPVPPALLDGVVSEESGWNANARNPKSGAFGLGGVLPSTAADPGFGMAPVKMTDLANPANALKFTAQYLYNRGKAMGMTDQDWSDPAKVAAVAAAYHGPATDADGVNGSQYAAAIGARLKAGPSWEVAQNGGTAMPGTAQPMQAPGRYVPAGMPTPQEALAQANAFDSYAQMFTMAGLDGSIYKDRANALRNYALGSLKPVELRQGGMSWTPNFGWTKNPDRVEVQNPDGSFSYAYTAPPAPGEGGTGTITPVTGDTGRPLIAKQSPITQEFQEHRGEDLATQAEKIDANAANAVEDNFRWDQMRQESQSWNMGKFAPAFGEANAYLQATAQLFGINMPELNKKVGDFQAFQKNAGQLVRTAVHETSARASQQEYGMIMDTLPRAATSTQAFGQIADQMQALNDYRIAKQQFLQKWRQGGQSPDSFNVAFNSSLSPGVFLLHRMNQTPGGQQELAAMLAKLQATANGRATANRLMSKYAYAQQHGYFDDEAPAPTSAGGH